VKPFELAGEIEQGEPLHIAPDDISLPPELAEDYELLYRVRRVPGFSRGNILIVEPRSTAATGELVIAMKGPRVYVGRWWAKHGLRQVRVDDGEVIDGARIAGAVNQIVRF
jgi:hypothetical protein